jgi:hypothetical protein
MAQAPQTPGGNDNFIRHIVTDPKNVPDVTLLTGYLGASSEEAHERLYLSPDLTNYVEIPKAAILHQAPLPKEQDAHGGVTLWVRKDAALQYKMAPAAQALANYFAGAIQAGAQDAFGGAGAAARPHVTAVACHATRNCPTFNCSLHCQTEITPCLNTHAVTCACPVTAQCPNSPAVICGTQGICTQIACGASLACETGQINCDVTNRCAITFDCNTQFTCPPVCAQAAEAARQTFVAAACVPHTPFCPTVGGCAPTQPPCVPHTPFCPTRIGCPPPTPFCPTHHFTCAHLCTHVTPCLPTRFEPQCPFPTEICTHAGGCQTLHVTCNFACQNTNPAFCQIASGIACPQVTLDCPQGSLACGGFPGQGGFGGQVAQQRAWSFAQCTEAMCAVPTNRCPITERTPCWM